MAHEIIERQLAHAERNSVVKAYNHAQYLSKRRDDAMVGGLFG